MGLFGVFSHMLGADPILGSFLAGMLLACFQLKEENRLRQHLEVIGYSFFIPIFFVMVGAHFHVLSVLQSRDVLTWIPFLIISAYAVKTLPLIWASRLFGQRKSIAGGCLLSSRMTLVIVAASLGQKL